MPAWQNMIPGCLGAQWLVGCTHPEPCALCLRKVGYLEHPRNRAALSHSAERLSLACPSGSGVPFHVGTSALRTLAPAQVLLGPDMSILFRRISTSKRRGTLTHRTGSS